MTTLALQGAALLAGSPQACCRLGGSEAARLEQLYSGAALQGTC